MNKVNVKQLIKTIIFILIIFIFSIVIIPKNFQNDLFFDLKTGESILKHGIDFKDHFSFIPNLVYLYHHYLYDIVINFIYSLLSYKGIFLFFLFIFTLFGISVFYVNKKRTNSNIMSLIVSIFTMYVSCYAFQSRVQSITYILFFLEVYFINKLYDTGRKRYVIYLTLISILIANIHMPLWIFTLILFLPHLLELIVCNLKKLLKIFDNKIIFKKPKNVKIFIITFIIILFTGLITPLKLYPYTFFTKTLFNGTYNFISEMTKTVLISDYFEIYLLILFLLLLCIKKIKLRLSDFGLFLGLFLFSLIANRNIIYVHIFFPTLIVKIIYESIQVPRVNIKRINKLIKKVNYNIVLSFTFICLIFISGYFMCKLDLANNDFDIKNEYPVLSVEFIKKNLDYKNIKLYNEFNYGSYIEFNDIPVFIDSRAEVYMKEFNGGIDVISNFLDINEISKYENVFEKYQFDYALVYNESNIYYYLNSNPNFKIIFREEPIYVLFKRV